MVKGNNVKTIIDDGIHNIKILSREMLKNLSNNVNYKRLHKKITLYLEIDPLTAFIKSGEFLYAYRDIIYNGIDDDKLLVKDFPEIREIEDTKDVEVCLLIMGELKLLYTSDPSLRKFYKNIMINILDGYLEYIYLQEINKK